MSGVSIKSLYALALAEGEGVGTAYEYFAKRLVLSPWLQSETLSGSMLVAGLPEKYGVSLDFLLLAEGLKLHVVVVDDRPVALEKARTFGISALKTGLLTSIDPEYIAIEDLAELKGIGTGFELCMSSEVMQRLSSEHRQRYWRRLQETAPRTAVFAPNADNLSHASLSGLQGIKIEELRALVTGNSSHLRQQDIAVTMDYIDMPPFPPGITRTEEQRERATSGRAEALVMWSLRPFAKIERFFPLRIRRRRAHIVYALAQRS